MSDITVDKVIEKLPHRFQADAAQDLETVFQFMLDDSTDFYIEIRDGQCRTEKGEHPDPNVTLITDADTFIRVVNGEQDGMGAFLKGQLRAEGNVMLATKLGKLFRR
ncbi:SCP2 sterol-binding domain-containing protein [Neptunomonas sp. XY-337]|uniref:SCP2 sterol-binding domain-containing protein n=1 Tax=Neptunomonas sp. XY-337 TaxID=2561897 RepID=UPI00197D7068|nr:SCP2 sterol-binding domain-containing protein [Neptunomonas sp. XY-337]